MYETEWQTSFWISECMAEHFLYSLLMPCTTHFVTQNMFPFPKHLEDAKGYELITNIILPEDFQASV